VSQPDTFRCDTTVARLNQLASKCTGMVAAFECNQEVSSGNFVIQTGADVCADATASLNVAVTQVTRGEVEFVGIFGCSGSGLIKDLSGDCSAAEYLNSAIDQMQDGNFTDCELSTSSTTTATTTTTVPQATQVILYTSSDGADLIAIAETAKVNVIALRLQNECQGVRFGLRTGCWTRIW
jgi:hypothetical protein